MKITLYEKCIVNNRYNEVFHEAFFENYLATLTSYEIDIFDTYTTFNGRIVLQNILENNKNIYSYNYMKVETDNDQFEEGGFTRYCFIDNIEIRNGYVYLDYSEDIWHSYSSGINIRNSYLTRTRKLTYGDRTIPVYRLPLPYGGNNLPLMTRHQPNTNNEYLIIARLQVYTLSADGGASTNRLVSYVVISDKVYDDIEEGVVVPFTNIEQVENTLSMFERQSAGKNFHDHQLIELVNNAYFEIDNIHVIPKYFLGETIGLTKSNIGAITYGVVEGPVEVGGAYYFCYELNNYTVTGEGYRLNFLETYYRCDGVIEHNFKNVSFGPLNKQIALDNNGSDINYSIIIGGSVHEFLILLAIQNKVIDITNTFEVVLPFNSVTGDVTAQRKIAFNTGLISQAMRVIPSVGSIAGGFSTSYQGMRNGGNSLVNYTGISGSYNSQSYINSLATETFNTPSRSNLQENLPNAMGGIIEMARLLAPKYKSETSVVTHTQGVFNCVNFPILTQMESDNDTEVEDAINNIGYSVDEIFDTEAINTIFDDYNIIQFDFINLYGNFPQNVANKLKSILRNGVKIWYTSNV